MNALLIRNPYPYGKAQIWLPTDLYKIAAQFAAKDIQTTVVDLNIEELPNCTEFDLIGIGTIGAPYIPVSKEIAQRVRQQTSKPILIGGQVIERLSPHQFRTVFGDLATQARTERDANLESLVGPLPSALDVSLVNHIKQISPETAKKYFEREFGFILSQGCKYGCDFCAASKARPEQYSSVIQDDLAAICATAQHTGTETVKLYLSSLDLFQNPHALLPALTHFANASEKYGTRFVLRGLSRVDSFLQAIETQPTLPDLLKRAGISTIGFGIDGTSEDVWKSQHKGNKDLADADKALYTCQKLGITPETLLVMGFHATNGQPGDTPQSLKRTAEYAISRAEQYGAIARPYLAKDCVPGNKGWTSSRWETLRSELLENPSLFKNLDFCMLGSELTHPDADFRDQANEAYLNIIKTLTPQGLCATSPLLPYHSGSSAAAKQWNTAAEQHNTEIPFDK